MNETPQNARDLIVEGLAALSDIQVELLRFRGLSKEATSLTTARLRLMQAFTMLPVAPSVVVGVEGRITINEEARKAGEELRRQANEQDSDSWDFDLVIQCAINASLGEPREKADLGEPRGELAAAHVRQNAVGFGARCGEVLRETCGHGWIGHKDVAQIIDDQLSKLLSEHSNAVLPPPVSESPVGSTATGVEDEEKIAWHSASLAAGRISGMKTKGDIVQILAEENLTAIRKSKSLSEPKELEEEKHD